MTGCNTRGSAKKKLQDTEKITRVKSTNAKQQKQHDYVSDNDEIVLSNEDMSATTPKRPKRKLHVPEKSTVSKYVKAKQQKRRDTACDGSDMDMSEEEISGTASDEDKFYNLLPNEKNLFTSKALVKFPLKEKVTTLVKLIDKPDDIPSCSLWHAIKKKWKVSNDGNLVDGSGKPICAYEDIYKTIYDIDSEGKFSQNITVLSDTVSKKYANITGVLVKFYCKQVSSDRVQFKRNRKNVEHDEIEKIKQDLQAKKLEKITKFEESFSACTAASLVKKKHAPEETVGGSTCMDGMSVVEPPVHSHTSNTNAIAANHGTTIQEKNSNDDSDKQSQELVHASEQSSGTTKAAPKELYMLDMIGSIAKDLQQQSKRTTLRSFKATTGIYNYDVNLKVCWLISFCQCIFSCVPGHVVEAVLRNGDKGKAEYDNDPESQFIVNAYDVMRQMLIHKTLEGRQLCRGSALSTPSILQIIDTINVVIQKYLDNVDKKATLDRQKSIRKDLTYDLQEGLGAFNELVLRLFDRLDITKTSNFCMATVEERFICVDTKMRIESSHFSGGKDPVDNKKEMCQFSIDFDNNVCARTYEAEETNKIDELRSKQFCSKAKAKKLLNAKQLNRKSKQAFDEWQQEWTCALDPDEWVKITIGHIKHENKDDYPDLEHNTAECQMKKYYHILTHPDVFIINVPVGNFDDGRFLRYTVKNPEKVVKIRQSPIENDKEYHEWYEYMISSMIFRTNSDPNEKEADKDSPGHYVSFVRDTEKPDEWVQWDDAIRYEYNCFDQIKQHDIGVLVMIMFRKILK